MRNAGATCATSKSEKKCLKGSLKGVRVLYALQGWVGAVIRSRAGVPTAGPHCHGGGARSFSEPGRRHNREPWPALAWLLNLWL